LAERLCLHDIDDTVAFCGAIVGRSGIELSHYEREDLVAHLVGEAWIILFIRYRCPPGLSSVLGAERSMERGSAVVARLS
jgi:hypothetical protein